MKVSLNEGNKRNEKVYVDVAEVCRVSKADQKALQQRKEDRVNALKSLEEKAIVARQKSQQFLERTIEALGMVRDKMLEQTQMICFGLTITTDQLNHLVDPLKKELGVDD